MKRLILTIALAFAALGASAQSCYWVLLTDKEGTTFDPYSYFDAKAIERYKLNNADLYDISNYPLNSGYVAKIDSIATEEVGQSRWFNAVAVMATDEQIARIVELPFVKGVDLIASEMRIAQYRSECQYRDVDENYTVQDYDALNASAMLTDQLLRMHGERFLAKGFDGTGIRIAVFDGGFHAVNTHKAFKHLRDGGRIIATWDFTKKRADVYDNHTHGTMVLSCIAGKLGNKQLGLATGASFLLAKTEVDPEPFKEEIWWAQAVEWADQNGADIINSSLGYAGDRHYTYEMDGRSYVSKAANMAARKGILVCNSAGNEGDEEDWKIIGAPADADSILSVGGIVASLTSYRHISFSSYGPTADGRMKPNVVNFGYAECANPHNDDETTFAYGTSFSSPLTTGFCACAWQAMRLRGNFTSSDMKRLVEKSGDLYPYFDYALGYGVPQATFFTEYTDGQPVETAPTFKFEEISTYVLIHPVKNGKAIADRIASRLTDADNIASGSSRKEDVVMFKLVDKKGLITEYVNLGIEDFNDGMYVAIPKGAIYGNTLVVHVNGNTQSYRLSKKDSAAFAREAHEFSYHVVDTGGYYVDNYTAYTERDINSNNTKQWGVGQKYQAECYVGYGIPWFIGNDPMKYSDVYSIGVRVIRNFRKWYGVGLALNLDGAYYRYKPEGALTTWDNSLRLTADALANAKSKMLDNFRTSLELFQRIRILPGGSTHKGLHWDLGIYGGLQGDNYFVRYNENENPGASSVTTEYDNVAPLADKWFTWGLTTRLTYDSFGLYARYRLGETYDLPHLELGLQLEF